MVQFAKSVFHGYSAESELMKVPFGNVLSCAAELRFFAMYLQLPKFRTSDDFLPLSYFRSRLECTVCRKVLTQFTPTTPVNVN